MKLNVMNKINRKMVIVAIAVLAVAAALVCAQTAIGVPSKDLPSAKAANGLSLTIVDYNNKEQVGDIKIVVTDKVASNCVGTPAANFEVIGDNLGACTSATIAAACDNATKVAGKTGTVYVKHDALGTVEAIPVTFNASGACSFHSNGLSVFSVVVDMSEGSSGSNGDLKSPQTGIFE